MENNTEKLTAVEAVTWWSKNKKWVIPTAVGIFAVLGGNADRLDEWLPALGDNTELVTKVETLEGKMTTLENRVDGLESNVETLVKAVSVIDSKLPVSERPTFREQE